MDGYNQAAGDHSPTQSRRIGVKRTIWLIMRTAAGGERAFRLGKQRTIIGREVQSDVRIPLPKVAPRHCDLILEDGQLRLRDLGASADGTLHNGRPVREAVLEDTDRLTVGPVTFEVRFRDADAQAEIEVEPSAAPEHHRPAAPAYTAARDR